MNNNPENIKAGDLVMVVRAMPCCGGIRQFGTVFRVTDVKSEWGYCTFCGHIKYATLASGDKSFFREVVTLKKIDPPEEGDSLPTRKDIESKETV